MCGWWRSTNQVPPISTFWAVSANSRYQVRPPSRSRASRTRTERPAAPRSRAAVRPARPPPTTTTSYAVSSAIFRLLPGRRAGRERRVDGRALVGEPPLGRRDLGEVDMHVLDLREGADALRAELAAEAAQLEAAERRRVVVLQRVVDPDRSRLELGRRAHRGLEARRIDARAQAEVGVVRELDRV